MNKKDRLINKHDSGFIMLGTALAIFLILSFFSIYLLRFIVNENTVSSYNLLDIRTRNLSISGLEHGIQLYKESGEVNYSPIEKNLGSGDYTISFDQSLNQNGTNLPYSHFTMLKSTASINDATRNTRVFLSSYPDAFNLAYFGNNTTFSQSGSNFNGDIYSNGDLGGLSIAGTAYTSNGNGGTIHPGTPPEFPDNNRTYFQTIISEVPVDSSGSGEEEEEESYEGWPVQFTNCNQTGRYGPSQNTVNSAYAGTDLDGHVTVNNGIQIWTVPATGTYTIETYGAGGSNGGSSAGNVSGGQGAKMVGNFELTQGQVLHILVGQKGSVNSSNSQYGGGGGGGTFVATGSTYSNATALIVAGGGGGGGYNGGSIISGNTGTSGSNGGNASSNNYAGPGSGGTNGNGATGSTYGGNGGGFNSNGSGNYNSFSELGIGFKNGGNGGNGQYGGIGGFGGGAGGYGGAGGAGGYSGGGGGAWSQGGAGGGAGSYNGGTNQSNTAGYNSGHGKVIIGPPGSITSGSGGSSGTPGTTPSGAISFTNCNQTGRYGPSQSQVNSAYAGTELNGQITVNNGIQKWIIPVTGTYTIETYGAGGGGSNGGKGTKMSGDFSLDEGDIIYILVGQKGLTSNPMSSGGGGTFVVKQTGSGQTLATHSVFVAPLIISGGGGGSSNSSTTSQNGTTSTNGETGYGGWGCCKTGGSNGNGGQGTSGNGGGGGGGGFSGNGTGYSPGISFLNGGNGGVRSGGSSSHIDGGFGGGGGARNNGGSWFGGGAGGGYSGGGGGCGTAGTPDRGGGGGSYNGGTNQSNTAGYNSGHGYVIIISPEPSPEEPPAPTSYTETGTINLNGVANTYGADVTFDGAIVNGPGKIISSNNITITNSSNISGGIEIISGGSILVRNSTLGNGVNNLSNSVVIYGNSGITIEQTSTVNGLSIIFDGETKVDNSTYYGAIYNSGTNCEISGASINGSIVSSSGLSVVNSTISKGNLPPIFGKPYGFEGDVIHGSYLEY